MKEPAITKSHSPFSMSCRVEIAIRTKPEHIWKLLTNAEDFPRWNSTVSRIEGQIRDGEKLTVHVPGTTRTFTPTVSGFVPNVCMTWAGGFAPMFKGVRTFELRPQQDGSALFVMEERFSGLMLPLAKGAMPDFGAVFAQYAKDLKREAERGSEATSLSADFRR